MFTTLPPCPPLVATSPTCHHWSMSEIPRTHLFGNSVLFNIIPDDRLKHRPVHVTRLWGAAVDDDLLHPVVCQRRWSQNQSLGRPPTLGFQSKSATAA